MISVVIPVYNCEDEIETCIRSVLENSCELEIVAINDGSKDRSGEVLDRLAAEEHRITVIHQENQGNSHTRDTGIQKSRGEYILFVDSDDELEPHALDTLSGYLKEEPDLLVFGFTTDFVDEQYSLTRVYERKSFTAEESALDLLMHGGFNLLWNKLYKASVIRGHHDFPDMKTTGQDFIFNCHMYPRVSHVEHIPEVLYHYKKRAKETMVTRYIQNGYLNFERKQAALKEMLDVFGCGDHQAYADYMIREYEVYTLNLFSANCTLSKAEKKAELQAHLLKPDALELIRRATPLGSYAKLFRRLALTGNAGTIVNTYTVLCGFRDKFGSLYRQIRRKINSAG